MRKPPSTRNGGWHQRNFITWLQWSGCNRLSVFVQRIAWQVDLIIPVHTGTARIKLHLIEQSLNRRPIPIALDLIHIFFYIIQHLESINEHDAQTVIRHGLHFFDFWQHTITPHFRQLTMQAGPLQSNCPNPYTHFQSLRHDTGRTFYKQNR